MPNLAEVKVDGFLSPARLVSSEESVTKILGILRDNNAYQVFLTLGSRVGMITVRDLLSVSNVNVKGSTVAKFIPKLSPASTVEEAARIMTHYRIRALPVVDGNNISGEITASALLSALRDSDGVPSLKARDIMSPHPITIFVDDNVSKAKALMQRRRIDHLPAVSDRELAGVVTSSHIAFSMVPSESMEKGVWGAEAQRRLSFPVKAVMNPSFVTCELDNDAATALNAMIKHNVTCVLVTLWRELQGIITPRDFVKLLAEPSEISEIPVYIIGLPDDPFEAEMAKNKFISTVNFLKRSYPSLQEARSTIRASTPVRGKSRLRYEVKTIFRTPRDMYTYSQTGWDLPSIFDVLKQRMKRVLSQKRGRMKPRLFKEAAP